MIQKLKWKIAWLMNRLPNQCWTDLVTWALGWDKGLPWRPAQSACLQDGDDCCYCGKLRRGEAVVSDREA